MKDKNIKKIVKIIGILICIVLSTTVIMTTILISNSSHLMCCNIKDCATCKIIQNSIDFMKIINYVVEYVFLINIVMSLSYMLINKIILKFINTLVFLNVRLDE